MIKKTVEMILITLISIAIMFVITNTESYTIAALFCIVGVVNCVTFSVDMCKRLTK